MPIIKRTRQIGVITGTILVKVPEKDDFQTVLAQLRRGQSFSVGSVFPEIGFVQLKVSKIENTISVFEELKNENRFENISIEVFTGGVRAN